jgi:hypothetical protein
MDNSKEYEIILQKLSIKHRVSYNVVKAIVDSQFEAVGDIMKNLDFKNIKSKQELEKLKTNFTFKYLFSLVADYRKIKHMNKNES